MRKFRIYDFSFKKPYEHEEREKLLAENRKLFREDLYYRLNIFPFVMPDLCKRRCDIILLAEHFIEKHNLKYGKNVKRLSAPAAARDLGLSPRVIHYKIGRLGITPEWYATQE